MAGVGFVGFRARATACALALAAASCGPSEGGNSLGNAAGSAPARAAAAEGRTLEPSQWDPEQDPEAAKVLLPVDPRHHKLELTPAWLEGYWVERKSACFGSDSGIHFGADGRWQDYEVEGRYSIRDRTVALKPVRTHDGDPPEDSATETFTVRLAGPNEIDTVWSNGAGGRFYRCPPGGLDG